MSKITVTAFKWVPYFAAGQVRDHRVRWILNEAGWDYGVRLIDAPTQGSAQYRACQPFGQVPVMEEEGRPVMFESGAIVLEVARRAGMLLGDGEDARARVLCWHIAALNSIEPFLMNVAEVDYFTEDEDEKALRRPGVVAAANERLGQLQAALGARGYLVGDDFTIADLMMSSVLKIARGLDMLEPFPALAAYQERCFARPAHRKAVADQLAEIAGHTMDDMKFEAAR